MVLNGLYISGYFSDDDKSMLDDYMNELRSKNVPFYVRNLTNTIMQSAFDFADLEIISVAYDVLCQFIISGGYDITKYFFINLWYNITKGRERSTPFTITIKGIPTINGHETIKCKIQGQLSDEEKEKVIDETFSLASRIEKHQYKLMKNKQYHNLFGGHLFKYDSADKKLHEIDIEAEIKKKNNTI